VVRDHVEQVFTVTEKDIVAAQKLVFERMKLVLEPSAGVGIAVALSGQLKTLGGKPLRNVGVVLCGGNQDLDKLPWVIGNAYEQDEKQQAAE